MNKEDFDDMIANQLKGMHIFYILLQNTIFHCMFVNT